MRITIIQHDGVVGVDKVFRKVDLSALAAGISAVQFDTVLGEGVIEYAETETTPVKVRDQEAEDAAWAAAREAGTPEEEIVVPVMEKTIQVRREHDQITDFSLFAVLADLWTAAEPPAPAEPPLKARLEAAVQAHMDSTACAMGYDNIFTACTYADEPAVPKFQQEGRALRAWRSQVWAACNQILTEVVAGTRSAPDEVALLAEVPALVL